MPIYEYECRNCGYISEIRHSISTNIKNLNLECSKCGSHELYRKFSTFSVNVGGLEKSINICPTVTCPSPRSK